MPDGLRKSPCAVVRTRKSCTVTSPVRRPRSVPPEADRPALARRAAGQADRRRSRAERRSVDFLQAFAGPDWQNAVIAPEEEHMLAQVFCDHYETIDPGSTGKEWRRSPWGSTSRGGNSISKSSPFVSLPARSIVPCMAAARLAIRGERSSCYGTAAGGSSQSKNNSERSGSCFHANERASGLASAGCSEWTRSGRLEARGPRSGDARIPSER